ncbi:oligopeptide-binding protein AppA [Terrilactibacillus sp. BCM23-1]|uniref:Oligopeptide-binding protein AppA n=2 Tax=Terrilactibacillus tamarindi TaxID=2599694 RepID=A0A6N8CNS3_9BACI|nr:oligopeptide-binding protein AppA [Terrilactibacillus tamarindi]
MMKQLVLFLSLISLVFLTACGGSGGSSNKGDKTMYIGMVNPPASFNPINSSDIAAQYAERFMFDSFLDMTSALEFKPKLADSIDTTDNQTYTIKLNPKAKWSDGQSITADDVVFTFNLIANPKTETHVGGNLSPLQGLDGAGKLPAGQTTIPGLKTVDEHTVEFKTQKPVDPNYVKEMIGTKVITLPEHVLKDVAPDKLAEDPFMIKPNVTSGPYKFVKYSKNQYVQYVSNDKYYLGKPKIKNMYIKIMPAPNLVAQLQSGEIQMNASFGIGDITFQDLDTVKKLSNVNTSVEKQIGFQTMQFNTKTIKDAKVRQAFVYAINRQQIVDKLLKGQGEIVDGPYTSLNPYLDKSIKPIPYDPNKAKQMLKDAGFDFNKTINFVVPIGNKIREDSANIIAENLKAVGVKVKTTTYDFPTIMQKGKAGDFDILLIGFTMNLDPDLSSLYAPGGTYNFMGYDNPENTDLLKQGKSEPDATKRKEIYNKLQNLWEKDMPVITLYSMKEIVAVSKNVTHGGPKPFGTQYDLQDWDLKSK